VVVRALAPAYRIGFFRKSGGMASRRGSASPYTNEAKDRAATLVFGANESLAAVNFELAMVRL
jgi:hypothetical protein